MDKGQKLVYFGISMMLLGIWALVLGGMLEILSLSYFGIFAPPAGFILILIELLNKNLKG